MESGERKHRRAGERAQRFAPVGVGEQSGEGPGQDDADREQLIDQEAEEAEPRPARAPDGNRGVGIDHEPGEVEHQVSRIVGVELVEDAVESGGELVHETAASEASPRACSRSRNFWILPVEVFGSGPKTMRLGALKRASIPRHHSISSFASSSSGPATSGRSVTKAVGVSPHSGSGPATTAASSTL